MTIARKKRKRRRRCRRRELVALLARDNLHAPTKGAPPLVNLLAISLLLLLTTSSIGCLNPDNQQSTTSGGRREVIIKTRQNQLFRGIIVSRPTSAHPVAAFLGLRYASAPVKRLRFMPPTPFTYAPNQIHDAHQFGPICMQRLPADFAHDLNHQSASQHQPADDVKGAKLALMRKVMPRQSFHYLRPAIESLLTKSQSEDCLNLNIYSPLEARGRSFANRATGNYPTASQWNNNSNDGADKENNHLRPVLVIIHGESFDFGAGSTIDGTKFAQQNRLLVVTFNYRLNILGFPPKLTGGSRGNLGLLDQVAALHWLAQNVQSFGGSPENITLMGTKKAAIFVNLLMLSPLAKGLFGRAILEDGAALTPLVTSSASAANAAIQPAVQHLRLLAKLCDCPLSPPPPSSSSTTTTMLAMNGTNAKQQVVVVGGAAANGVSGRLLRTQSNHMLGFKEEPQTNALLMECLRHKPVEQIMQRIPLDLLQLAPAATGEWHIRLVADWTRRLLALEEELSLGNNSQQTPSAAAAAATTATITTGGGSVVPKTMIDSASLARLITFVGREALLRGTDPSKQERDVMVEEEEIESLLRAIYLPPSHSVRPLFGPQLEEALVAPLEDPLQAPASTLFGSRDLLLGLSGTFLAPPAWHQQFGDENLAVGAGIGASLGPNNLLASYTLSERQAHKSGLAGDEQTWAQVNAFVRAFYRHHQQEIANSIINTYLGAASATPAAVPFPVSSSSFSLDTDGEQQSFSGSVPRRRPAGKKSRNETEERQVAVLETLFGAFQEALVAVPVVKTALLHSMCQLDLLADIFVGQQAAKLLAGTSGGGSGSGSQPTSNGNASRLLEPASHWEAQFHQFARALFQSHSAWPLELHFGNATSNSGELSAPTTPTWANEHKHVHSTYLYQLDPSLLLAGVRNQLADKHRQLEAASGQEVGSVGPPGGVINTTTPVAAQVQRQLEALLNSDSQLELRSSLTFGCPFSSGRLDDDDEENRLTPRRDDQADHSNLNEELLRETCSRLGRVVANFVASGNVNVQNRFQTPLEDVAEEEETTSLAGCSSLPAPDDDHHAVHSGGSAVSSELTCEQSKADRLAVQSLFSATRDEVEEPPEQWSVFNVFTQQIGSLLKPSQSVAWEVRPIFGWPHHRRHEQSGAFAAHAIFWANFISTLNCSRTQPLPLAARNGSSLLNLNLMSNCQQGAGRSASQLLDLITVRIHQQLGEQLQFQLNLQQQQQQIRNQLDQNPNSSQSLQSNNLLLADQMGTLDAHQQPNSSSSAASLAANFADTTTDLASVGHRGNQQLERGGGASIAWRGDYLLAAGGAVSLLVLLSVLLVASFSWQRGKKRKTAPEEVAMANMTGATLRELHQLNVAHLDHDRQVAVAAARENFREQVDELFQPHDQEAILDQVECGKEYFALNELPAVSQHHMVAPPVDLAQRQLSYSGSGSEQQLLAEPIVLSILSSDNSTATTLTNNNNHSQIKDMPPAHFAQQNHHQPLANGSMLTTGRGFVQVGAAHSHHNHNHDHQHQYQHKQRQLQVNGYGGSSSEITTTTTTTTRDNNSSNGTCKKRVKIHDPLTSQLNEQSHLLDFCPLHQQEQHHHLRQSQESLSRTSVQLVAASDEMAAAGGGSIYRLLGQDQTGTYQHLVAYCQPPEALDWLHDQQQEIVHRSGSISVLPIDFERDDSGAADCYRHNNEHYTNNTNSNSNKHQAQQQEQPYNSSTNGTLPTDRHLHATPRPALQMLASSATMKPARRMFGSSATPRDH